MATVHFSPDLAAHTGGLEAVVIDAPRVHELCVALVARFPGLAPALGEMAIAIDGEIFQDAGYQPLARESDVHLVPRMAGG